MSRAHARHTLLPSYALTALRPDMARYETNRQVIHLSAAKRSLDQADHFSGPCLYDNRRKRA
jgi:hypothetical protein